MEDLLTFVSVTVAFYGAIWVIAKLVEALKPPSSHAGSPKSHYDFYDPDKPRKPSDPIVTRVAGVTFEGRQSVVRGLRPGEMLELHREPDNPHDANAVKVVTRAGQQVGYVPRELAKDISWVFEASFFTRPAKVLEVVGEEHTGQSLGVIIEIYPPTLEEALVSSDIRYPRIWP